MADDRRDEEQPKKQTRYIKYVQEEKREPEYVNGFLYTGMNGGKVVFSFYHEFPSLPEQEQVSIGAEGKIDESQVEKSDVLAVRRVKPEMVMDQGLALALFRSLGDYLYNEGVIDSNGEADTTPEPPEGSRLQ